MENPKSESSDPPKFTREEAMNTRDNFVGGDGRLYLVRCPVCIKENWAPFVMSGRCAWCGASEVNE